MSVRKNSQVEIATRFIDIVWNGSDATKIDDFISTDFVDHAYDPRDADGHKAMVTKLGSVLPDARWTIDRVVGMDDQVMVELTLTGTHQGVFAGIAPHGNAIKVRGYRTFVFSDDKICAHHALLDTHTLMQQMSGTRVA
ncbi:ester cyclase [Devosia rhodophyticola]|uniref:Ester cyclase n=1 Tax=Devosia rhodophyticola TaxID=3026423 RepID=A0ABY7YWP6_9HYPH|nr:ester cyclase [Devosia rhodophyticola]WDR05349.1 ester cyclase [Devosia rhodophyticola]